MDGIKVASNENTGDRIKALWNKFSTRITRQCTGCIITSAYWRLTEKLIEKFLNYCIKLNLIKHYGSLKQLPVAHKIRAKTR